MTAAHGVGPAAVRWYERARKAVAVVLALAAVPGVLGLVELIPGVHLSAGTFAAITGIAAVLVGGGTAYRVPNTPSLNDVIKAAADKGLMVQTRGTLPGPAPAVALPASDPVEPAPPAGKS